MRLLKVSIERSDTGSTVGSRVGTIGVRNRRRCDGSCANAHRMSPWECLALVWQRRWRCGAKTQFPRRHLTHPERVVVAVGCHNARRAIGLDGRHPVLIYEWTVGWGIGIADTGMPVGCSVLVTAAGGSRTGEKASDGCTKSFHGHRRRWKLPGLFLMTRIVMIRRRSRRSMVEDHGASVDGDSTG